LITSKGYPCEDHTVITVDGYVLSIQRIPYGKSGQSSTKRPVVFLQHGLLDSSATWVLNLPSESLGFILADAGYDVWMGNSRGNTYSHSNIYLSDQSDEFWTFTWDEMGESDLPTMVDYALNASGQSSLYYIGHSQGNEQAFAFMNTQEWADKVRLFIALAPVAYLGHCESKLLVALAELGTAYFLEKFGYSEFLPSSTGLEKMMDLICDISPPLCQAGICAIAGCDPNNINSTRMNVYWQHYPAGTSTLDLCHYTQQINRDNFTMYDFGEQNNLVKYGSPFPPAYNLGNVTVPMALISGGRDTLGDPTDVARLINELPPNLIVYQEEIDYYAHLDFTWGLDAGTTVYQTVLELLEQY